MTDMNPELRLAPEGTVFDEYVAYVRERHRIWELRSLGLPAPWTRSPILGTKKFTNDFRVLDTGSQYVLRMVQDVEDPIDVVLRAFLYRFTNLPEPWEAYREEFGRWPEIRDVGGRLDDFLRRYAEGASILNSAYVIAPPSSARWTGVPRIEWLLWMIRNAFLPGGEFEVDPYVADPASTPAERHAILTKVPRCGDFLGLQVVTDIGYSDLLPSDEDEFVVPGPGSTKGLAALGRATRRETAISEIRSIHSEIRSTVVLDVRGTPRPLSLMDVQNTLCEFSKYHRLASATGTSRKYDPAAGAPLSTVHTDPSYPNHWS